MSLTIQKRAARGLGGIAAAVAAMGLAASPALAAAPRSILPIASASCPATPVSQPFAQWGDTNSYELVPGGSFNGSAPGWTLTGGARVITINVPFGLAPSVGALYLPPGASARSPLMCVDASDPTYRFLALGTGSAGMSAAASYATPVGFQVPLTASAVALPAGWGPSPQLYTGAAPAGLLSGGAAQMSLSFTAANGPLLIGDVFVDPRMRE